MIYVYLQFAGTVASYVSQKKTLEASDTIPEAQNFEILMSRELQTLCAVQCFLCFRHFVSCSRTLSCTTVVVHNRDHPCFFRNPNRTPT